jgi:hypothetical protein
MKRIILSILAVCLIAGSYTCQETIDIEKEKEAIIAIIEEERAAYMDRNFSRYEATWKQESTSRKYYMSAKGITKLNGWSEIAKFDKPVVENATKADRENTNLEYLNFDIIVSSNTALVFHDSHWTGKYQGKELDAVQARILHLVKVGGEWKLDLMAMYRIPKEEVDDDESED